MAIKEAILAAALSTSPEACEQKTVSDQLSSCQKVVHQVMESKRNPHKVDENIMKVALKIGEKNPISTEYGYEVASNGKENYKELLLEDILNQVKKKSSFKEIPEDEKEDFLVDLNLAVSGYEKEGVKDVLEGYDFSDEFISGVLKKVPGKLASVQKISVDELEKLLNMNIDDVLDEYIKTGILPKGFDELKEEFDEIVIMIKKIKALEREGKALEREGKALEREGKALDKKIEMTEEIGKRLENIIKKIKLLKKDGGIA